MRINILAFGIAKEIFGANHVAIEFDGHTSQDLRTDLEKKYPRLKQLTNYMLAVNNEYAEAETQIGSDDEIAIIPPVSGG
jgi:molybdopterin synthase sulfur carrier subunit